jgi:hypothetical protein
MEFKWIEWNLDHATQHGVTVDEIEALIAGATRPFPEYRGDGKWLSKAAAPAAGSFRRYIWLKRMAAFLSSTRGR